jgi:uracil phosphoribosyltransferase
MSGNLVEIGENAGFGGGSESLWSPKPKAREEPMSVKVIDHPLVQHKLTIMRNKETSTASFRRLLREISTLLCYEVTRDLALTEVEIETPLQTMTAPTLEGKKLVFASVLRAGNGLLEGMLDLVPAARVSHIGIYRDHETLQPVEYYFKAPADLSDRLTIVVDPMLATGNSSIAAVDKLKERGARDIRFVCLLAAPEGIKHFTEAHPDVPVFTAAIDSHLNEKGYIVPGLGDAGDRMYGTK